LLLRCSLQSMFSEADPQLLLALLQECAYSTADAAQVLLGDAPLLSDSPTSTSSAAASAAASSFAQVLRQQPLPRPLDKPLTTTRRLVFGPASSGSHASSSSSFSSGSSSIKGHRKGTASASRPPVSSCNDVLCSSIVYVCLVMCWRRSAVAL
jgi:hypothetical protein